MSETEVENFIEFCNTKFGKNLMNREAELITDKLSGCEKTLSIGCGIGSIGERIDSLDIIHLDSSPHMLSEAGKRVRGPLVLGDAEEMPFREDSFDCAYAVTVLEFIEHPEKAVRETARILKPNGRILALMLNPSSEYFKSHFEKKDSYFRKIHHHPKKVEKCVERYFSTESEYFLGIQREKIFDSENPKKASLYVVEGFKTTRTADKSEAFEKDRKS